jgi:hypothetical protein
MAPDRAGVARRGRAGHPSRTSGSCGCGAAAVACSVHVISQPLRRESERPPQGRASEPMRWLSATVMRRLPLSPSALEIDSSAERRERFHHSGRPPACSVRLGSDANGLRSADRPQPLAGHVGWATRCFRWRAGERLNDGGPRPAPRPPFPAGRR